MSQLFLVVFLAPGPVWVAIYQQACTAVCLIIALEGKWTFWVLKALSKFFLYLAHFFTWITFLHLRWWPYPEAGQKQVQHWLVLFYWNHIHSGSNSLALRAAIRPWNLLTTFDWPASGGPSWSPSATRLLRAAEGCGRLPISPSNDASIFPSAPQCPACSLPRTCSSWRRRRVFCTCLSFGVGTWAMSRRWGAILRAIQLRSQRTLRREEIQTLHGLRFWKGRK